MIAETYEIHALLYLAMIGVLPGTVKAAIVACLTQLPKSTPPPAIPGRAGGALCCGAWADHPEPVQELSQEERGQQRLCVRPQSKDGTAPSLQTVCRATSQGTHAGTDHISVPGFLPPDQT